MEWQVTRQGVRRDLHFRGRLRQGCRSNTRDNIAAYPSDSSLLALWQAPHNSFVKRVSSRTCVEKAEERMKYAKSYFNRHRELFEKDLISRREFEESKEKLDVLEKELKKAQAELKIVFQPFFYRNREENEARKFAVACYNRSVYKPIPITLKEDNNGSKTFPHFFVSNHDNSGWMDTGGTQQTGG